MGNTITNMPDYFDEVEAQIVSRAITGILKAGYAIRVYDYGWQTPRTRDREVIKPQIGQTDSFRLYIFEADAVSSDDDDQDMAGYVGNVLFIMGNHVDIISDWAWPKGSDNDALIGGLLKGAQDYADKVAA